MAAYSLGERFPRDAEYYRFYDPGAYQYNESNKVSPPKPPFLSKTPRKTLNICPLWTHAIYDSNYIPKIPNCTSLRSKSPRFPYEALSKEDLEEILCRCGIPKSCQCPIEEEGEKHEDEIVCQGKISRHIIKGPPPRTGGDSGLSAPSKGDHGFKIHEDGIQNRLRDEISNKAPPFYNTRVVEATMFYQGCKWSKWSGKRTTKLIEQSPGPADYTLEKPPNEKQVCDEKVRAKKRKESKQYRYIEMVQRRNILENAPGPSSYSPMLPKGTDLTELGSKASRFPSSIYDCGPGPAHYNPKRHFDSPEPLLKPCKAALPEPAFFGVKAKRFKPRKEEGPSPASYSPKCGLCQFQICSKAPFGSTVARFKTDLIEESIEDNDQADKDLCPHHTWEFKSKTVRMKPLFKRWDEPSPADFSPDQRPLKRHMYMQYIAPFYSSDGRFQPWYNDIHVFGKLVTPGPGYYSIEKPKCNPAVTRGPLFRDQRFRASSFQTPAPNEYEVGRGIENVLETKNKRLKSNIKNKPQNNVSLLSPRVLTAEVRDNILINKCIAICDEALSGRYSISAQEKIVVSKAYLKVDNEKSKLLRCFLYKHAIPPPI